MHSKGCPVIEAYNTPTNHRILSQKPPKLRLLPNKNGGQNKRVAKKPLPPLHPPLRQKRNKTKPTQRPVETATANLHTQSNKQRKTHNARTAKNQTKIQRNHTSRLNRMLLPEINKLTYNLVKIPDSAISPLQLSSQPQNLQEQLSYMLQTY
jgi:hypothetical protein